MASSSTRNTRFNGVMTSGFTFIRIDAHDQEMVKGAIIAAAVADMYRQRKRRG